MGVCGGVFTKAADVGASYEVTLVASIILGVPALAAVGANPAVGLMFPLAARAIGAVASIAGVYAMRAKDGDARTIHKAINRGLLAAGFVAVVGTFILAMAYVGNDARNLSNVGLRCFGAVVVGLILAQLVGRLTEHRAGTAAGLESSVYALIGIVIALGLSLALAGGNLAFGLYLVALTGMGMLGTTGVIVSAVTTRFAIGATVIASLAIFASFIEHAAHETLPAEVLEAARKAPRGIFDLLAINLADPKVVAGLLIGGAVPFLFSARAIRPTPGRRDHGAVVNVPTVVSSGELATPALLAVLTPVIIGFGINFLALGAFLVAVILVGQLMANHLGHPLEDAAGGLSPLIKVMSLIALLILPAVIDLGDNDAARYTIAGVATLVLVVAVAFSKREDSGGMGAPGGTAPEEEQRVSHGEAPESLALQALDRWMVDLGDDDPGLRRQLRAAKRRLKEPSS